MRLFAIHAPRAVGPAAGPEDARAARIGFAWTALIFGPLWLLARGVWIALLGYILFAAAAIALLRTGVLSPVGAAGLFTLGQLYLAVEGRALATSARERAGRPLVDIIYARSAFEAEKIHLERVLHAAPAAPLRAAPPAQPEVIGLFPEPGR